jgi:hypothetical protein
MTPAATQSGNVSISYHLIDAESDTSTISVAFSSNGGTTFAPATPAPGGNGTTGLASSPAPGTALTFVWNSLIDLGGVNNTTVQIRITPNDGQAGAAVATANFRVDNSANTPPSATITTPGASSGNVSVSYHLIDAESDLCNISVQFSKDGGATFAPATIGAGGDGITNLATSPAGGTAHTFVWNSVADGVALLAANATVQIRITPNDGQAGAAVTTASFTVDNTTKTSGTSIGGAFPIAQPLGTAAFEVASDGTNLYVFGFEGPSPGDSSWRIEKRLCSTGALVASFGTAGVVTSNPGPGDDSGNMHIRIDGTYMYLMSGRETSNGSNDFQCYLEKRLLSTGALVTAFNSTGTLIGTDMGIGGAGGMAIDGTAIYLSMAVSLSATTGEMRIEKRDITTGALVSGFGSGGVLTEHPTVNIDGFLQITLDSTSMYLAGGQNINGAGTTGAVWLEKRLLSDGSLVSAFGTGGSLTQTLASPSFALDITNDGTSLYVFVFNAVLTPWHLEKRSMVDGSLLASADSADMDPGLSQGAAGAPSQITLSGTSLYVFGIDSTVTVGDDQWRIEKRKTSDLSLDTTFGTAGVVLINPSAGSDGAIGATVAGGVLYVVGMEAVGPGWEWLIEALWQ